MARIRIVDEWLRSPASPPSRHRAIMVVAERWGEQRVLMRAYQECADQTRPTVALHGVELAIGPAGADPAGPWGIHVQPPADGRAQELRDQLELAARRLVGSRERNPARLEDEQSKFDGRSTSYWAPGSPRDRQSQKLEPADAAASSMYEPALVAPPERSTVIPSAAPRVAASMSVPQNAPESALDRRTPVPTPPPVAAPRRRRRGWTSPIPNAPAREVGARTALGFAGAPHTRARPGDRPDTSPGGKKLSKLVGRTMPVGFQLSVTERDVLNSLGEVPFLTARRVAEITGAADPVSWMDALLTKLSDHGLDLIAPGDDQAGEPTYILRR